MNSKKDDGVRLLEEVLNELENPKSGLLTSIQKLNRAAQLLNENDLIIWTEIQLGEHKYIFHINSWKRKYLKEKEDIDKLKKSDLSEELLNERNSGFMNHISDEEIFVKTYNSGGGFQNIGFIEEQYNKLIRTKEETDGTYYFSSLSNTISVIKSIAYKKVSYYHKKYAYEGLPASNFEVLKKHIEDKLLDIDQELAEKLMQSFKSVSSDKQEEWSQALTTCRRFLQDLADILYPPTVDKVNGRDLKKENYLNRIWAYMDKAIESETNKEIAKSHVDFIGSLLQKLDKITSKGVHASIERLEALKTVLHIYLLCADIISYIDKKQFMNKKPNIHTATIDELMVIGKIPKTAAKEIIKLRANKNLTIDNINNISGMSPKRLEILKNNFSFEKI